MLIFWVSALLMIAIALALLLPAFWGRYRSSGTTFTEQNIHVARDHLSELKQQHHDKVINDEQYQQQRSELEQTLALDLDNASQSESSMLGDKRTVHVLVLSFVIPVATFSLYFSLGKPEALIQKNSALSQQTQQHSMAELIARLEQRLKETPDDAEGWMMLGRTYMSEDRFDDAARAFEKVLSISGDNVSVLFAQADALAMSQGGRLSGKPAELVKKALKLKPDSVTGLWLAGLVEEEQGNYKQAIEFWQKAERLLAKDPGSATNIRDLINRAKNQLKENSKTANAAAVSSASISVRVDIADKLITKVQPNDTLFIYARAANGSRMPLAIIKKKAVELPVKVILNDEMAMMPSMALSNFSEVNIYARISRSGQAISQSGDLLGEVKNVSTNSSSEVNVSIDQTVP